MCLPIIIMNEQPYNRTTGGNIELARLLSIQQSIVRTHIPYEANLRGEGVGVVWV